MKKKNIKIEEIITEFDKLGDEICLDLALYQDKFVKDFIRQSLSSYEKQRNEELSEKMQEIFDKTKISCDSLIFEECNFCQLKSDIISFLKQNK